MSSKSPIKSPDNASVAAPPNSSTPNTSGNTKTLRPHRRLSLTLPTMDVALTDETASSAANSQISALTAIAERSPLEQPSQQIKQPVPVAQEGQERQEESTAGALKEQNTDGAELDQRPPTSFIPPKPVKPQDKQGQSEPLTFKGKPDGSLMSAEVAAQKAIDAFALAAEPELARASQPDEKPGLTSSTVRVMAYLTVGEAHLLEEMWFEFRKTSSRPSKSDILRAALTLACAQSEQLYQEIAKQHDSTLARQRNSKNPRSNI